MSHDVQISPPAGEHNTLLNEDNFLDAIDKKIKSRKCNICDKVFTSSNTLNIHVRRFHMINKAKVAIVCEVCNKTFQDKWSFLNHKKTVHNLIKNDNQCGIKISPGTKTKHTVSHRITSECKACDLKFEWICELQKHKIGDHQEQGFTCEICQKSFLLVETFKSHLRTHQEYISTIYGQQIQKSCFDGSTIKTHRTGHKQPCECKPCGLKFKWTCNLRKHWKNEHKGKCFACEICSKDFWLPESLKSHINIHKEENPLCCEKCGYTFDDRDKFQTHCKKLCK